MHWTLFRDQILCLLNIVVPKGRFQCKSPWISRRPPTCKRNRLVPSFRISNVEMLEPALEKGNKTECKVGDTAKGRFFFGGQYFGQHFLWPRGRLILWAEILTSNKSALCPIASLAFSFVLVPLYVLSNSWWIEIYLVGSFIYLPFEQTVYKLFRMGNLFQILDSSSWFYLPNRPFARVQIRALHLTEITKLYHHANSPYCKTEGLVSILTSAPKILLQPHTTKRWGPLQCYNSKLAVAVV